MEGQKPELGRKHPEMQQKERGPGGDSAAPLSTPAPQLTSSGLASLPL